MDKAFTTVRDRSGSVNIADDKLTSFLYDLMKSHVPPGVVETLVIDATATVQYSNGWLASYAKDVADRLR